jgi:hypothetical protein
MTKLSQGDELEKRCVELGVSVEGPPLTQSSSGRLPRASDFELQRRLLEAERSVRESKLWLLALVSALASVLSAAVALIALFYVWSQHSADYDKAVLVQPGTLPLTRINKGQVSFNLEVANTSKSNLQYYLRANTNMGCLEGANGRPLFIPCGYESQVISLSKSDAGKSSYKHSFKLDAYPGAVKSHPLAYISEPNYFLAVEIIDASNGRILYKSECFYGYHLEAKVFSLDQPVVYPTGQSERRQRQCRS